MNRVIKNECFVDVDFHGDIFYIVIHHERFFKKVNEQTYYTVMMVHNGELEFMAMTDYQNLGDKIEWSKLPFNVLKLVVKELERVLIY